MYDQLYTHSLNYVSIDYSFSFWGGGIPCVPKQSRNVQKTCCHFLVCRNDLLLLLTAISSQLVLAAEKEELHFCGVNSVPFFIFPPDINFPFCVANEELLGLGACE